MIKLYSLHIFVNNILRIVYEDKPNTTQSILLSTGGGSGNAKCATAGPHNFTLTTTNAST